MIYSLENSTIKITVSTDGAELHSIKGKREGTEYLWNGNPEFWKYHAPHLFPIVGKLVDSEYRVDGESYEMPPHGFARISEFEMIGRTNDSITFRLTFSEETLKVYPYKFSLLITYTLEESSVKVTYIIINSDNKEIFFSIGAHPAFMCPIKENEKLEDYYLEFNKKEDSSIIEITKDIYLSRRKRKFFKDSNILNLTKEIFEDGVLIFDDLKSNKIALKSKNHNKSLCVEFEGFPYVGIWAPETGAPFVCIEPWFGHADYEDFSGDFREREGILGILEDEEFNYSYKISIVE